MALQDPKLQEVLDKITRATEKHPSLREELTRALLHDSGGESVLLASSKKNSQKLSSIERELRQIREIIGIGRYIKPSIDYSFISDEALRQRLQYDNLRMEYEYLRFEGLVSSSRLPDTDPYESYCLYAVYQIEGVCRWVVKQLYPNVGDLAEAYNRHASPSFLLNSSARHTDLRISNIIFFLLKEHKVTNWGIDYLRELRNVLSHPISEKYNRAFYDRRYKRDTTLGEYKQRYYPTLSHVRDLPLDYIRRVVLLINPTPKTHSQA